MGTATSSNQHSTMYFTFVPQQAYEPEQVYSPSKEALARHLIEQALAEGFEKAAAEKESKKKPTASTTDAKKSTQVDKATKKRKQPTVNKDASTRSVRRTCNNRTALPTSTHTVIEQRTPLHVENETSKGGAAKMSLDVTGFAPSDIKLSVENSVVSIKGERTNKLGDKFVLDRKFRLDKKTTQAEKAIAKFDDGILEVTIPTKKPEGAHRSIPIAVSTTPASAKASADESNEDEKTATEAKSAPAATEEANDSKKTDERDTAESKEKK